MCSYAEYGHPAGISPLERDDRPLQRDASTHLKGRGKHKAQWTLSCRSAGCQTSGFLYLSNLCNDHYANC